MKRRAAVALGILLSVCPDARALNPSLDISQYAHTSWTIRDGFFKGRINSIAQTPDGYLWLGTEFGLLRFDGVRAVPWQPPAGQSLPGANIIKLLVTHDGRLWVGTRTGLASWKDGRISRYPELDGQTVGALLEDSAGTVWAGSLGFPAARLCSIQGNTLTCAGQDGRFGSGIFSLFAEDGTLWASAATGLWRWRPGPPKRYAMPFSDMSDLIRMEAGPLLIATHGALRQFNGETAAIYPIPGVPEPADVYRLRRTRNGDLWMASLTRGLIHWRPGRTDTFTRADGLSSDLAWDIFEDREGTVWVATSQGLDRFRAVPISALTTKQGLSSDAVMSVLAASDGSVWLGTRAGLNRWNSGRITGYLRGDGSNGNGIRFLFQDDRGRIWVSSRREIGYFEGGRLVATPSVPRGDSVQMIQEGAGSFWENDLAQGLINWRDGKVVRTIPWAAFGHDGGAASFAFDSKREGFWVGFTAGGIVLFQGGRVRASFATPGPGPRVVTDVHFDSTGAVWVSTSGGLMRIKENRSSTLNTRNGMPCDTVHWMIEDNDRAAWLYTSCGLVRITRAELDAWIADPNRTVGTTVFDASDGVPIQSSDTGYNPKVSKAPDGRLWFATGGGVSIIDPRRLSSNEIPPPVHIEQITADRKTYWQNLNGGAPSNPRLPALSRDLVIDYTALSLAAPEKVRFKYKLEGRDAEWQDAGNRRQAFFSDLGPRKYRFRVIACNNSGLWNETGASIEFSVAPAYYQTLWFRSCCAIALLALLVSFYRYRLYQVTRDFDVRMNERTRIARELHDTLLQSFQGLMLRLQAVDDLLPEGKAKKQLEQSLERADQAIAEGRSAVHDLRLSAEATNDLAQALKAVADELGGEGSAAFNLVVEGRTRELHPILRDEVYRIAREGLRNAFQHAGARHIETEIAYGERTFRLRIRDDGNGIPADILEGGRSGHYGLSGMRERARQCGARLEIWSGDGSGTEIELTVPGPVAYGGSRFSLFRRKVD